MAQGDAPLRAGRGVSLVTDFNLKVEGDDALARR